MAIGKNFQIDFEEMEREVGREKLIELINRLPCYRILLLEALEGSQRTYQEIASELGISRGRVAQKTKLGVRRLRCKVNAVLRASQVPVSNQNILDTPCELAGFSVRLSNSLQYAQILTIGDLIQRSEFDLLLIHNFGKRQLQEVKDFLEEHGLNLRHL